MSIKHPLLVLKRAPHRRRTALLCALSLLVLGSADAQIPQPPQVFTIEAGQCKSIWFGIRTVGTVYLRIRNDSGNCAKFFWKYAPIKRGVGTLCNDAQLKNFSPIAELWIDRPATATAVALGDDARTRHGLGCSSVWPDPGDACVMVWAPAGPFAAPDSDQSSQPWRRDLHRVDPPWPARATASGTPPAHADQSARPSQARLEEELKAFAPNSPEPTRYLFEACPFGCELSSVLANLRRG